MPGRPANKRNKIKVIQDMSSLTVSLTSQHQKGCLFKPCDSRYLDQGRHSQRYPVHSMLEIPANKALVRGYICRDIYYFIAFKNVSMNSTSWQRFLSSSLRCHFWYKKQSHGWVKVKVVCARIDCSHQANTPSLVWHFCLCDAVFTPSLSLSKWTGMC